MSSEDQIDTSDEQMDVDVGVTDFNDQFIADCEVEARR